MNNKNEILLKLLKLSIPNEYADLWNVKYSSESFMHIFATNIVLAIDILNTIGNAGIKYSLSYSIDDNEELLISKQDPLEIEIHDIPDEILAFG